MMDRGIDISQIKEAVTRGAKKLMLKDTKKVYPITVIEL